MLINTNGEFLNGSLAFSSLFMVKASDLQIKTTRNDAGVDIPKIFNDGRSIYKTQLKALKLEDGVPVREEKNVSLAVLNPVDIAPGVLYGLAGGVQVVHYQNDAGRLGVSITAERLVKLDSSKARSPFDAVETALPNLGSK